MDAELYKNAIKDAIASEIEAKEFYLEISKRIRDDYLKELFHGFSKEEAGHEKILNASLKRAVLKPPRLTGPGISKSRKPYRCRKCRRTWTSRMPSVLQ